MKFQLEEIEVFSNKRCFNFELHDSKVKTTFEVKRQEGRKAGRQADRQTGRQADRQTGRQADRQTGRQADRQTGREPDSQTARQPDSQAGRQTISQPKIYSIEYSREQYRGHHKLWQNIDFIVMIITQV